MNNRNVDDLKALYDTIAEAFHPFIHEHEATWCLMQEVRSRASIDLYRKALDHIRTEIEGHFAMEEVLLLLPLERYLPRESAGPAVKLREEHRFITEKYKAVERILCEFMDGRVEVEEARQDQPGQELIQQMNTLAYLIMKHIEKENHYLFPLLSLIFSPEELREIAAKLQGSPSMYG